jgi:thymidylate synthase (FAD)
MPKNNNLEPAKLPMNQKFGLKPSTAFVNNLDAINVELLSYPSITQLRNYIPGFVKATWAETCTDHDFCNYEDADKIIMDVFQGKTLPTAMETIGLVWRISGISLQEVTHILRHRMASFSADCSGDKWWSDKDALIPNSIENSAGEPDSWDVDSFADRYMMIVRAAKQLYCDMIDSKKISIMDARYILPRCLSTFYYMRMNLKDTIAFIKQRMDKQIQPETDNIIAYKMYMELMKVYPYATGLIDIHAPSAFYVKMARTGQATNLYQPDADSDTFEWNEKDFIYQCKRDEMNGTDEETSNHFNELLKEYEELLKTIEEENRRWMPHLFC